MANKNEAKIKFTADCQELNAQISKSNSTMQTLRAELKLNETQMKATGESVEGLEQKHSLLQKQLDASKDKVSALQGKLDAAIRNFGEGSTEVDKWRTQLLNAQTAQVKMESSLRECESELDKFKSGADKAEDATDELEDTIDDAADAARDAEGGFTVLKGALADLVSSGIQSAISGIGDLASSVMDLEEETKEYRTIMASLDSSSKLSGYTAEETSASFKQLNGVLGDTQSAATTTANLQAIGLEQDKLQSLTDGVIGAWAKYGDSIPIDGLGEAINHTAQLGEVQGTLADVLEWGGLSVEDFNEKLSKCSNETERADLIAKMLADQGLTEAGKAWQETNQDIVNLNNAQAEYQENTATLSERIAPVTASVRDGFNGVFEKVLELTSNTDLEGFANTVSEAFGTFTNEMLPKIVEGFTSFVNGVRDATTWMKEHQGVVIAVAAVIGTLVTAIGLYNAVQTVKTAMEAANVTTVWALVSAHIAQAAAAMAAVAPYILIVAAIAAVIAIIVLLVKNWDVVVEACKKAWEKIKEATSTAWEAIKEALSKAWEAIKEAFSKAIEAVKNAVSTAWEAIKTTTSNVWNAIKTAVSNVWNGIKSAVSNAINAVKSTVSNVWNSVKSTTSNIWNGIKSAISNVWNGIKSGVSTAVNAVKSTVSNVFNTIKSTATSVWNNIKSAITKPIDAAKQHIRNALDAIKGFFSGLKLKLPDIKLPHFSLTGSFSLNPPSVPKLSVSWYKDAMNNPTILNNATIFGYSNGRFLGGGEAGSEMIGGTRTIMDMIQNAVDRSVGSFNIGALADAIEDLASRPIELAINGRQFAVATASDGDSVNGLRSTFKTRGLIMD